MASRRFPDGTSSHQPDAKDTVIFMMERTPQIAGLNRRLPYLPLPQRGRLSRTLDNGSIGGGAIDGRTLRHVGYALSQSRRAMIECILGWGKQQGTMRKTKLRGVTRVAGSFLLNVSGYNLFRLPRLIPV